MRPMIPTADATMTYKPNDVVAYHGELAAAWEARYQKRSFQARLEVLEECLRDRDLTGTAWLDAGCGTGTLTRFLAARGCIVKGLDAAPQMIEMAKEQARKHPASAELTFEVAETIEHLPIASVSLDGVLCSSVLEYVEHAEECLSGFARVLRPGGLLLISVPNAQSVVRRTQVALHRWGKRLGRRWLDFVEYSHNEYSARDFELQLRARGFETQKVVAFGSPMPRWAQRQRMGGSLLMFLAVRK
jgi:2-polyprenyl-6-hydroxyphenyl methylase/3-demethylubiquinone-9 3-methyltransferase